MICNRNKQRNYITILIFFFATLEFLSLSISTAGFPFVGIGDKSSAYEQSVNLESVTPPDNARISERIFGLKGLSNVGRVSPVIYRGAQPLPEGYSTLKRVGIKTVINLRTNHSEKEAVEKAGMKSIEVPFSVLKDVDSGKVTRVVEMMVDPANQPLYVHCRQGQDRTGVVIAAYRIKVDGWALKDVEAEMQAFGFNDIWYGLKKFVREYARSLGK